MTPLSLLATVLCSFVVAELIGYWLHVLMHSERVPYLSRHHMIHHLVVYAPDQPQRPSGEYVRSTYGRANVAGLGAEWLGPIALIVGLLVAGMTALGLSASRQAVFVAGSLGWGALMFWYMHDAMHLKGFWMEASPLWRRWFLAVRRRHDVHHMDLGDDGRMTRNYGICLFVFDRLFGTFQDRHERFNRAGLYAARLRYAALLGGALSDR